MSSRSSSANDVFAKPKRPMEFHRPGLQARGHDLPSGKQRKYLQLKEKIMRTDELIQKYRQKVGECEQYKQQLKEVQTKLSIEEKGRNGLLAELSILHKESKVIQVEKDAALAEIERLQLNVKEEEMVKKQLMAQLGELRGHKEMSGQLKEELTTAKSEMEKFKRMYQKIKQEFEVYKAGQGLVGRRRRRRTSEANSLPTPIISPPLSEVVLSPLSTCSLPLPLPNLPTTSLVTALPIKKELVSIAAQPHQQLNIPGFDPCADLSMDNGSEVNLLDTSGCDTGFQEKSANIDGCDDVIIKSDDIIGGADSKVIQSQPHVQVSRLSDDSDSDTSEGEQADYKSLSPMSKKRMGLDQQVPINDDEVIALRDQSDSRWSLVVPRLTITNSCPVHVSGISLDQEPGSGEGCKSEGQTNLSQELFGDFDDSLSHLSVSDSSSCCSHSSLGSVDDLGDLLRSDSQFDKEGDNLPSDSVTKDGSAIEEGANTCDLVRDGVVGMEMSEKIVEAAPLKDLGSENTGMEADISPQTADLNYKNVSSLSCGGERDELKSTSLATQTGNAVIHHQKLAAVEQNQTPPVTVVASYLETSVSSDLLHSTNSTTVCEGPMVFLPKIEVEAAPADTASSEDSDCEMDVSFSTLFGDEFQAISPLPPSPLSSHVCGCPSMLLSPLPPSPVKREPLSPLPQTPHKDLKSISPLPPSPINARPAAISPIPPTPTLLNGYHHEIRSIDSLSPEEISRDSDTSPVQFDDAAPINVHVPKPCNLSITIHTSSDSPNSSNVTVSPVTITSTDSPSPKKRKLRVSETSPFSPLTFVLPSSVEASSVFGSTVPTDIIPNTTESTPSTPLRQSSMPTELASFDRAPATIACTHVAPNTDSGVCTSEDSSFNYVAAVNTVSEANPTSSPTRLTPTSAEAVTVPVFEAVSLTKTIPVFEAVSLTKTIAEARKPPVATSTDRDLEFSDGTVGREAVREAILPPDGLKEDEVRIDDKLIEEADIPNKSIELINELEIGRLGSELAERAVSNNVDIGELAGTTSLAAVANNQWKVDKERAIPSLQVIKTEGDNPGNLTTDSSKTDSLTIDEGSELITVDQVTRSTEPLDIKSEKNEEGAEKINSFKLDSSSTDLETRSDDLVTVNETTNSAKVSIKSESKAKYTELFGDSEESDIDLLDDNKLISDATLLSSGSCTSKSPVEEGEIEDSEEEGEGEEEKVKLVPSIERGWGKDYLYSSQKQHVSGLPVMMDQQKGIADASIQLSSHDTHPQMPPPPIHRTIDANNRNLQQANDSAMTATTFDDLLNTFCPRTRSGKKVAMCKATAKTNLLHASPEKPMPLARLLSTARNKPKKTNQATKPNAATFIGVQRINPAVSLTDRKISSLTVTKDQKEGQLESQADVPGKRSAPKRFERMVSTEEPASKRPKLENVVSTDCPLSEHGSSCEEDKVEEKMGNPLSPLEATSPRQLPGYQLRTRNVLKFKVWPKRRKRNSSGANPEAKKTIKSESSSGSVVKVEEHQGVRRQPSMSKTISGENSTTGNPSLVTPSPPSENTSQEPILVDTKPIKPHSEAAANGTVLSPGAPPMDTAPPTDTSSQPTTTSILADSSHLDSSSDAGDSDEALMIGDLESLLDVQNGDTSSPSSSVLPQLEHSSLLLHSQSMRLKPHIRKTDSATGQEEDQTPASSPKTGPPDTISKQLQTLSEQRKSNSSSNVCAQLPPSFPNRTAPPSLAITHSASHTSAAVGYGQPQHTPLPEYKPDSLTSTATQRSKDIADGPSSSLANIDDDNVFSTPLPLLEKPEAPATRQPAIQSSSAAQPGGVLVGGQGAASGTHPGISLAQHTLTLCMKSPLPLPPWLVTAMTRVQSKHEHCAASGAGLSKKKRGNAKEPIMRQRKQKIMDYVMVNLERLVCGHLHLSTVLTMFTNQRNVPSLEDFVNSTMKFLLTRYNPKIEHVVSVFHTLCDDVRGNPQEMCPLSSGFPPALLRPECQLVALFLQMSQLYPSTMAPLLVEMNKALYQAMLKPSLKFHKLSALGRILTAICRLQGDADRVLFLAFDLLKKPLTINELAVMAGLASVWPTPLARRRGVKLVDSRSMVLLKGLEQQPLSYTLEVLVMTMMQSTESKGHANLPANLHTLCHWGSGSDTKVSLLTNSLIKLLQTSDSVYIVSPQPTVGKATDSTPWHRPRPSVLAFHIVHCLRAIAHYQGWVWTNDTLIRGHLWPLLQQWNANQDAVREAAVVCTVRLIGFISKQGLTHDPASSSVGQLQRVFITLLNKSDQISFPVQLAAVDSLLELCPPAHPRSLELVGVVKAWLKRQSGKPHGMALCNELGPRLQALTVT